MDLVAISSNAADVARRISGIRYSYPREVDTIAATPAVMIGMATAREVIPGNRQVTNLDLPIRLYVERVSDQARDVTASYGYVNSFVFAYASSQSLGGTVDDAYVTAWDTNVWDSIGGAMYSVVEFTLSITVHETVHQSLT